jgi:hypothetical protein
MRRRRDFKSRWAHFLWGAMRHYYSYYYYYYYFYYYYYYSWAWIRQPCLLPPGSHAPPPGLQVPVGALPPARHWDTLLRDAIRCAKMKMKSPPLA